MTGPEHYTEAQRLLGIDAMGPPHSKHVPEPGQVARAQVHALLALTAATATGQNNLGAWFSATLTVPADPDPRTLPDQRFP